MSSSSSSPASAHPIVVANRIKRKLKNGEHVFGLMVVEFDSPVVAQLLANCGYDFIITDNEHGYFSQRGLSQLSRATRQLGLTPIVRVPDPLSYQNIAQALDGGAQGIMFPRIVSAAQVKEIISIIKYPPVGVRGNALTRAYTDFKGGNVMDVMKAHNDETLVVIQIETKEAMQNLDEILSVKGVDIALVGPNDLSISLGVPGDQDGPVMRAAMTKVIERCNAHGVIPALHINDLSLAQKWSKAGMKLVSVGAEVGLMMQAGTATVNELKKAIKSKL